MAEKINKNDFVEMEFTAKTGENIFDTNIKEIVEKEKLQIKDPKPFVFSVGHSMTLKGLDKSLEGKEVGKTYTETFPPEQAFGKRDSNQVKMIPEKAFLEQKIRPQKGMQLSLDGRLVKVLSVSGGRVLVDFNNPLAGKDVTYEFTINRKITDQKEKVKALQDFFFRKQFEYELKDKEVIFKVPKQEEQFAKFVEMMAKPFEDILGLKPKAEILEDKKN